MGSGLFPPNFPPELEVLAFKAGEEVAWPVSVSASAVEWFGRHGYAVLGTELWLLKDGAKQSLPIGPSGMREVYGNTVNRKSKEAWSTFVARAAAETGAYLQEFNPSDIVEGGEVYFNVVWVSEDEFKNLSPR
jgi:hypothetical protein